jgi:formiminoglutamase
MTHWQPASPALWQGRDDSAESPNALRLFQTITQSPTFSPEMYREQIALLGFAATKVLNVIRGARELPERLMCCARRWRIWPATMGTIDWWIWAHCGAGPDLEGAQQALRNAVQRCQQENMRTLFWVADTKPHMPMVQVCWTRSRRRKWG